MSGKGNVKVDAILYFDGFVPNDSPVALSLAGTETELAICDKFDAIITITPTKFYEMMKAKKEDNMVPVFRVEVVDPDTKTITKFDEPKKDDSQKQLNLDGKAALDEMMEKPPAGENAPVEATDDAASEEGEKPLKEEPVDPADSQTPETPAGTDLTKPKHVF